MDFQYYIILGDKRVGPMSAHRLTEYHITPYTMVWRQGLEDWQKARLLPELAPLFSSTPPPSPVTQATDRPIMQEPCPKTWLAESILVTILCCLPCGIVGIIFASQVTSAYTNGDYQGAVKASYNAGLWTKIGFFSVLILYAISFVCVAIPILFIN